MSVSMSFPEYSSERSFLLREINELEQRLNDTKLQLKHNKEALNGHYSQKLEAENKVFEREIMKLELAIEERYTELRKLIRDFASTIYG